MTTLYVGEMNGRGIRIATVTDPRNAVCYAFDEEAAAHIVRCVNSHDALVEALQRILSLSFETSSRPDGAIGDAKAIARAALKAATE